MTEQQTPSSSPDRVSIPRQREAEPPASGSPESWSGWVRFGGIVMAVTGTFSVLEGILALAAPTTYVTIDGAVLAIDLVAWGWLHLALGVLVLATGAALLGRDVPGWARALGIGLVTVNMIVQLAWLPAYPIWSILVLALDGLVLYALMATWDDTRA
ncbi:DUF7144 family membrane protein [Actinomycetospora chibensis]|uniref:DUF7144 domain-containing protein n=1 Tax=Actinomycetospora chibensis TaxID=663606 RepID=A0ABV9RAS3_9PSEU|nr:hypothetical protein [Actinomycetospora chibensis]MDD7922149.1 hypothetical protein [Actinomycetospora chibensis]